MADPGAPSAAVAEISTIAGIGDYLLGGVLLGMFRFGDFYGDGATVSYVATDTSYSEIVTGTYDAIYDSLSRDTLVFSNTGSFIAWPSSGQRIIRPLAASGAFYISFSVGGKFGDLVADEWDGNYEIFDVQMPSAVSFPADFSTSQAPGCEVVPAADATLTFQTIDAAGAAVTVGTATIPAGALTGSYSTSGSPVIVPAGHRLRLYAASATIDLAIVGFYGTLSGSR